MDIANKKELKSIFALFSDKEPVSYEIIETGKGETDLRCTLIFTADDGSRLVIKLSDNDFTSPERIKVWQRISEEYNALGCYCPKIYTDKSGGFPCAEYNGHSCVAYAEEYAKYRLLQERDFDGDRETGEISRAKWLLTAKVAAKHFDFAPFPSGYCLFERFCPSDKTDEVTEQAQEWKAQAQKLPDKFQAQVRRIIQLWLDNRAQLEKVYPTLPTSVFQADLNSTNLLVDDDGNFAGLIDMNISGREVFLNYIFRENFSRDFESEIYKIRRVLCITSQEYIFSDTEKEYALMLYRCLKPIRKDFEIEELLNEKADDEQIQKCLDRCEHYLTADIDFKTYMNNRTEENP